MMEQKLNKSRLTLLFSALIMVALLSASLPVGASAAASTATTSCRTYYVVRSGDSTPYIAHTFGLRWKEIAKANDLVISDKPKEGLRLCIPFEDTTSTSSGTSTNTQGQNVPHNESNAVISISANNGVIFINTDAFKADHNYLVKARSASSGVGGWSNLGYIKVDTKTKQNWSFRAPGALKGIPSIHVCLKDQTTDELICRAIVNR